jgi:hypothetical protein
MRKMNDNDSKFTSLLENPKKNTSKETLSQELRFPLVASFTCKSKMLKEIWGHHK